MSFQESRHENLDFFSFSVEVKQFEKVTISIKTVTRNCDIEILNQEANRILETLRIGEAMKK